MRAESTAPATSWGANKGEIVGDFRLADDPALQHAFVLQGGDFTPIEVPDATATMTLGINAKGEIVGWYTTADGTTHASCAPASNDEATKFA
jgi:hypothetical protein